MDLPKPTEANELRDAARVIAVGLVPHGAQPGLDVTAFKADRAVPRCTQLTIKPGRGWPRFEPYALEWRTEAFQQINNGCRLGCDLLFEQDVTCGIHDAHVDGFQDCRLGSTARLLHLCRLGLDGDVPDHSTFSKNRHGRFRESDLLRKLFETVVARCMKEGIVGGEAFAVDASIIVADAHRRRGVAKIEDLDPTFNRAVAEYLSVLDDAAFGGATPVEPKLLSPTDPAARYTAAANTPAVYAYSDNYLIDLKKAVIMDVEATTAIRQAEVGAAKTMLDRTTEQFDITPSRLVADAGYGSAEMIEWLVDERGIEPHVKLMDKSERTDGTFSRSDFAYDPDRNRRA